MHAYDYKKQQWTEGREGAELRLTQLHQELNILTGPHCDGYLRMLGLHAGHAKSAIEACQRGITACERELDGYGEQMTEPAEVIPLNSRRLEL